MNSVKNRWLFPRSESWELLQRAMNSAISAMVFPDFLNKKRVFGAKTPLPLFKNYRNTLSKKASRERGRAIIWCLAIWLTGFALGRNCYF